MEDPLTEMQKYLASKQSGMPSTSTARALPTVGKQDGSIEQLRSERLQRESAERQRANQLLHIDDPKLSEIRHGKEDRFFHSQFNPSLVRHGRDANQWRSDRESRGAGSGGSGENNRFQKRFRPY
eukprot:jgi/Hompol1/268/HPOL_000969-RA